jgi:hypothetical protein
MHDVPRCRGTTLVEALVATSLLVALVSGVAHLLLSAKQWALHAELVEAATLAAEDRLERLRAVSWSYDLAGRPVGATELEASPSDTLVRSTPLYEDTLARTGEPVSGSPPRDATFVRRWAVAQVAASDPGTRLLEVCVYRSPAPSGAVPIVCLATIRTRQP